MSYKCHSVDPLLIHLPPVNCHQIPWLLLLPLLLLSVNLRTFTCTRASCGLRVASCDLFFSSFISHSSCSYFVLYSFTLSHYCTCGKENTFVTRDLKWLLLVHIDCDTSTNCFSPSLIVIHPFCWCAFRRVTYSLSTFSLPPLQNPNAASPLGQMPPNDAIPSGSMPPGFFPNSQMRPSPVSQPSPHPQQPPPPPPPHGQMMPNQFMSPRYPSGPGPGPRPGVRMPPQQVDFTVSSIFHSLLQHLHILPSLLHSFCLLIHFTHLSPRYLVI